MKIFAGIVVLVFAAVWVWARRHIKDDRINKFGFDELTSTQIVELFEGASTMNLVAGFAAGVVMATLLFGFD